MENLFVQASETLAERLKNETRPIVLYGMGNGGDKIFALCDNIGVMITDVYASDEFVRGHSFHGIRVKKYSEIESLYDDFVILLGFAVFRGDLMERIDSMAHAHTLYVPDVPLFGDNIFDIGFFNEHYDEIERTYSLLADDTSKQTFADIINAKLSGSYSLLRGCETDREEVFQNIIRLGSREKYIDIGAYDGDTIEEFLTHTAGRYARITAFEPDVKNMKKLSYKYGPLDNCRLYPYASWSGDAVMHFSGSGGRMSSLSDSGFEVQARAVDSVCMSASYIKMDVEGAEYETLLGCRRIITRSHPALAVSAYHRSEDIFRLPLLINEIEPKYKIYLRHHRYVPAWETNLYCVYEQ